MKIIKVATLWQPWASLMAVGKKKIETRSWKTSYRGPLIIHAAARHVVRDLGLDFYMTDPSPSGKVMPLDFPLGAALGICDLIDCISTDDRGEVNRRVSEKESLFGDYSPGRFMWITENMKKFNEPMPTKGARRLWNWNGGRPWEK